MPLVGIDCRFGGVLGGLGTYTRSLVDALMKRNDPWSYALFVDDESQPWLDPLRQIDRVTLIEAPFPHYSFREQTEFPNLLQDISPDFLLFPHFNVPLSCTIPYMCTVHDLILHRFPNESGFLRRLAYRFVLRQSVARAEAVSVVSHYTKSDLSSLYGPQFDTKVHVIYPGVSEIFVSADQEKVAVVKHRYGLEKPYLLYIGNCKEHKNVPVLLDAFLNAGIPGMELVLVTGGRETARLRKIPGVRILAGLSESDLPPLLSGSAGCVTATLLEGFCLPLIEAMACRTPVMATWTGPIPEVCDGHALLVEPTVSALSDGLRTFVSDASRRTSKSLQDAEKHARTFAWSRTANETAAHIRSHLR